MDADDTPTPESDDHIILTTPTEAFAELADLNDAPDDGADADRSGPGASGADDPAYTGDVAPPVVAVVVVHNPDESFDQTLRSLGEQTYENLSVLVIDADSDIDPTPRIAQVLPGAFVRRLEHNVGFGPTLNETLELVSGASFHCLCHDDVVLDPDCVHELVSEAFRSNAGIVGPKLVDWDDPERLLSVGFTIDVSAGRAPYAEHHELDQGQHDAVRDVFAVEGGCTLVRADLFSHLGGFDPGIDLLGEDLDLCWRAHLVGARVVVAPRARVRHREMLAERVEVSRLTRVDAAHRMRTVFSNTRLRRLLLLIPQLVVISIAEAIVEFAIGRRSHARAQLSAWGTTLRSIPTIARSRKRVRAIRERDDREIRRLQTRSWARLDGVVQAHRRARADADVEASAVTDGLDAGTDEADSDGFVRTGTPRRSYSLITWALLGLALVVVVGSRELFFGSLPAVGSFAAPPAGLSDLWHLWWSTWNPTGLGSATAQSAGIGPMAVAGTVFGGALGVLRRVAILLPVPIGLFGAWRVTRAIGSRRAQLIATVVYAAVPVPWNALARGSWAGLIVYAAVPWMLHAAVRSMRVTPWNVSRAGLPAPRWWVPILGSGLLLGVAGSLVPAIIVPAVTIAVGLVVGSLLVGRVAGLLRLAATTAGALVVAGVLMLPWTFAGPAASWWSLAGRGGGVHGWYDLGALLRFQSGPMGSGVPAYAFLVAAALPLVIGRSWRFAWGVRAWSVSVVSWAVLWAGQQDWFGIPLPPTEVLLAPAAIGLAVAAACGAAAVEADLPSFRFGLAQVSSVAAAVAVVVAVLPLVGNAADGRWRMAPVGLDQALEFITTQRAEDPFRVVWVGDPAVVPVAGRSLDDGLVVGVSNDGMADMTELWAPAPDEGSDALGEAFELAMASETTRVGGILAGMDVRYVVLPRQAVPLPYRSDAHRPPTRLLDALDDQLDLARVSANDAVVVYRNEAWEPGARILPADTAVGDTLADALDAVDGEPVEGRIDPSGTSTLTVPGPGILTTGQPADPSWRLTVDGDRAEPVTLWGWEQGFEVTAAGEGTLTRSGSRRPVVVFGMAALWLVVIGFWIGGRRRPGDDLVPDTPDSIGDGGSLVRLDTSDTEAGAVEVEVEQLEVEPVEAEPAEDATSGDGEEPDGSGRADTGEDEP